MPASSQVFKDLGTIKPVSGTQEGTGNSFPKLPADATYLLEITHCALIEGPDCGVCQVIEHKCVESSTPQALPGQMFVTTITHLTEDPYRDLKQGKVRNFLAAVFGMDQESASEPWAEVAVYANDKGAAVGKRVRATTSPVRKSKSKGRAYVSVDFQKA